MKQIKIYNDYNSKFLFNSAKIKSLILNVFEEKQIKLIELSIILTNNISLSKLKKKYFNVHQFTDVIAFNLSDEKDCIEGEIYISIDDVKENSEKFDQKFDIEFKRVLIHGVLHILGFEDASDKEKKNMRNIENKYLNKIDSSAIIKV